MGQCETAADKKNYFKKLTSIHVSITTEVKISDLSVDKGNSAIYGKSNPKFLRARACVAESD